MYQEMPGTGDHRLETTDELMFALRAGIETRQTCSNRLVDTLIEAGLEMQPVEFGQASPIAPIKPLRVDQAEGHGHRATALLGQHHANRFGHTLGQQTEETTRQIGRALTHVIGIGIAGINEIPLRLIELMPLAPVELDALGNHLLAFLAHLLALARSEAVKTILEIAVTTVVPVELTTDALQPAIPAAQQGIGVRLSEVEVQPRLAPFSQIGRKQIKQLHGRLAVAQQPSA